MLFRSELYNADESHPSLAGSYAAACTFYSIIFRKDPTSINFISTVDSLQASQIRNAAKLVAYDSLYFWNVGKYDVKADFSYITNNTSASFTNLSTNYDSLLWNFGDGHFSTSINPTNLYNQSGIYNVTLVAYHCGETDTILQTIQISQVGINENSPSLFSATLNSNGSINILGNLQAIDRKSTRLNSSHSSVSRMPSSA